MTEKSFDICAVGNAIVDIFIEISEVDFTGLGYKKASMELVEIADQQNLIARFAAEKPVLVSGGSIANSIVAMSQLGSQAAMFALVADDRYGLHYEEEFESLEINFACPPVVGATTGTCVALVTPDGERTMRTCLGVSANISAKNISEAIIADSRQLVIEGYLLSSPDGLQASHQALKFAKQNKVPVVGTLSAEFIVNFFKEAVTELVQASDILIANIDEARAYTGKHSVTEVLNELAQVV